MDELIFTARKYARDFRRQNGLSDSEPVNIEGLLIKLGVITVFKPLGKSFSGMAIKNQDGTKFMMINSNDPRGRQNFSISHELYHLFIQEEFTHEICLTGKFPKNDKNELLADWFAAYFLVPDEGLEEIIPFQEQKKDSIKLGTLVKIEQAYGCSRLALLYRLKNLGRISQSYLEFCSTDVKSSAKYYHHPVELYEPARTNLVLGDYPDLATELFESGIITEGHYISLMADIGIDVLS
ncbi:MAG: ImmA/IrrE family metallo-endopeptidase [Bacteroidia bacterium]|nr:ImmA/IrrE family metallo-endopeptidase [Bacteroidia bacterium]